MDNISNETHVDLSGRLGDYSLNEQCDKLSIFFPTGVILRRRRRQAGDVKYICVYLFFSEFLLLLAWVLYRIMYYLQLNAMFNTMAAEFNDRNHCFIQRLS
jgi:hypothetical protein